MATPSFTSNYYLVPREDWKTNLERFSNGAKKTESEVNAQLGNDIDILNTNGKVVGAAALAVATIAVGILLGIIINPAAYAICFVSTIYLGVIVYCLKQDESYKNNLEHTKRETDSICKEMIKAMRILRYKIASESLSKSKISSFAYSNEFDSIERAEKFSMYAVEKLLKDENHQVTKDYLSIKDFVKRIATPTYHGAYGAFHNDSYTQQDVKNAADLLIYGYASRSINFNSTTKSYHEIETISFGHYKLAT